MQKKLLIKQILYRSTHRGCKETDILLGKFFTKKLQQQDIDEDSLQLYQNFITENDALIYDWVMEKEEAKKDYQKLVKEIRKFHNI